MYRVCSIKDLIRKCCHFQSKFSLMLLIKLFLTEKKRWWNNFPPWVYFLVYPVFYWSGIIKKYQMWGFEKNVEMVFGHIEGLACRKRVEPFFYRQAPLYNQTPLSAYYVLSNLKTFKKSKNNILNVMWHFPWYHDSIICQHLLLRFYLFFVRLHILVLFFFSFRLFSFNVFPISILCINIYCGNTCLKVIFRVNI